MTAIAAVMYYLDWPTLSLLTFLIGVGVAVFIAQVHKQLNHLIAGEH